MLNKLVLEVSFVSRACVGDRPKAVIGVSGATCTRSNASATAGAGAAGGGAGACAGLG